MEAAVHGNVWQQYFRFPHLLATLFALFLVLELNAPAAAFASAGAAADGPAGRSIHGAEAQNIMTASPSAAITLQPALIPRRLNRTTVLGTVKNAAERPKVSVPAGVFFIIVAIAAIGLCAILYLLIHRNAGSDATQNKKKKPDNNATAIEEPVFLAPEKPVRYPCPAGLFPPSLEKRFLHPEFIGEGGLARVFRARDANSGKTVAVKIPVRFDEVTGTHFTRDILFWQGLKHENIIRILSFNILPVPYIEMEYAPLSFAALPKPLPEEKAVKLLLGVAYGLAYAHEKGIIHRDIKPENILITADGVPKITDWGLGKAVGDSRHSSVIGFSPEYAAPEQIAPHRFGRPGPATDIYQLGMLLFEMLEGAPAFKGEGVQDLTISILEDKPVLPPWNGRHGDELGKIIRRCLAKKPEERYSSVADLIRDLESVGALPKPDNAKGVGQEAEIR